MIHIRCEICGLEEDFETEDAAREAGWNKIDGEWYCDRHWFWCQDCDQTFSVNSECYIESMDRTVCRECLEENYTKCAKCDEYEDNEEIVEVNIINPQGRCIETQLWCHDCAEQHADWDDEHEIYEYQPVTMAELLGQTSANNNSNDGHVLQLNYNEQAGPFRCNDCCALGTQCPMCMKRQANAMLEEETHLWVYDTKYRSYHPSEHKKFKSTKYRFQHEHPYLYYGIELEVLFNTNRDIQDISRDFVKATNGLFVTERDGSVSDMGNGCEFISRPLSYKKWMSKEVKDLLDAGAKVLRDNHAYSPQPNGCGLHVHMSLRFFEENTKKRVDEIKSDIDWIFQVFQKNIEAISQRKYTRYCASKEFRLRKTLQNSNYVFNILPKIKLERSENGLTRSTGSGDTHHDCIIQTERTIEIRTFNSTIVPEEILATIEFCRAIAHAARNMNMTKDTTFGDILDCKSSTYLDNFIKNKKIDKDAKFVNSLEVKF